MTRIRIGKTTILKDKLPLQDKWDFSRFGIDKTGSIAKASGEKTFFGTGGEYKRGPFNDFLGTK